jgi:hypothetical protein
MRTTNRFAGKMLVGAIAIAMMALAASVKAEDIEQFITVVRVKGHARYSTDAMRTWRNIKHGDSLKPGAIIQTADDGSVDVMLSEKRKLPTRMGTFSAVGSPSPVYRREDAGPQANMVRIFPSTVLTVDKLTCDRTGMDEVTETQLDLKAGRIMGEVKKLSAASRYEIKIPNGVAGIRGTTYVIGANGRVYVLTGSVVISYVNTQGQLVTATVSAGYYYDPFAPNPTPIPIPNSDPVKNQPPLTGPAPYTGPGNTDHTTIYVSPR